MSIQADFGVTNGVVNTGNPFAGVPPTIVSGNPSIVSGTGTGDFYFSRPIPSFFANAKVVTSLSGAGKGQPGLVSPSFAFGELTFPQTMDGKPGKLVLAGSVTTNQTATATVTLLVNQGPPNGPNLAYSPIATLTSPSLASTTAQWAIIADVLAESSSSTFGGHYTGFIGTTLGGSYTVKTPTAFATSLGPGQGVTFTPQAGFGFVVKVSFSVGAVENYAALTQFQLFSID